MGLFGALFAYFFVVYLVRSCAKHGRTVRPGPQAVNINLSMIRPSWAARAS
jgi:hypothetical protein